MAAVIPSSSQPVEPSKIYAPDFRIEQVVDDADGCGVNVHIQTFEKRGDVFYSDPPERWPLLARLTPQYVRMFPIFANNPYAQRYKRRQQPMFSSVVYADFADEDLPVTAEQASRQVGDRTGYGVFKDHYVGLGFVAPLDVAAHVFGQQSPGSVLVVVEGGEAYTVGPDLVVPRRELEDLKRVLERIAKRKNEAIFRDRCSAVINIVLSKVAPGNVRANAPGSGPQQNDVRPLRRRQRVSAGKQAARQVRQNLDALASSSPGTLMDLKAEIELVTLREMIVRMEELLASDHREQRWQQFFQNHLFVLSLIFSTEVKLVRAQPQVRGADLAGKGQQIGDFLMAQLGGSMALIEIKRPSSVLTGTSPRNGIHAASSELTASIVQVMSQRNELRQEWQRVSFRRDELKPLGTERIRCIVIIGTMPDDADERRSFQLFRDASTNVEIVTYDELLAKLKFVEGVLIRPDEKFSGSGTDA